MAFSMTFIEIGFQFRPTLLIILNFQKMFPLGRSDSGNESANAERDELREARFIAMRKITAFIPTAKTLLSVLWFGGEDQRRLPSTNSRTPGLCGGPGRRGFGG